MTQGDVLIDLQGIAKHYGEGETRVDALRSIDLQVRAGEVIALLGPSGSGKTTLLKLLNKSISPTSGTLWYAGTDLKKVPSVAHRRQVLMLSRRLPPDAELLRLWVHLVLDAWNQRPQGAHALF